MPFFNTAGGILFLILSLLAYILLAVAIVGGTFLATAICTGLLVAGPALVIVQRAPTVRRGFFSLTDSFFARYPTSLKDKAFLTVYIGSIGLYSIGCLIALTQALTAIGFSSTSYPPNQPIVLFAAAVFLVGIFAIVRSGRLQGFGSRVQSLLEWTTFTACITVLASIVVFEMLLLVLDAFDLFL